MAVLTTPQACAHINSGTGRNVIGPKALIKLAIAGQVPAMKLGGKWVYSADALDGWLSTFGAGQS